MPLFKKHRELPAQLNQQILCAGGALHHQCKVLLLHVIKVRVVPCVHGDLLPTEQHQQLPLLFSGIKIALRAVPVCVHRCSSVYKVCGVELQIILTQSQPSTVILLCIQFFLLEIYHACNAYVSHHPQIGL